MRTKIVDRGEPVARMEPVVLSESCAGRSELTDLALELGQRSAGFRKSLPEPMLQPLASLVRSMNCYYSNLIEGHDTHPIDIERALADDYSHDPQKRNLQLEAKAHITVQEWIDRGGLSGGALTESGVRQIHSRFCDQLPSELLQIEDANGKIIRIVPGTYRTRDVKVGQHVPISPGAISRFMERFEQAHARLGTVDRIFASATAHHRLAWIHPFLDGNGRVVRLMSYAILRETLDTGGLWSVARGLARKVEAYKQHLANCDPLRRNDLDGRGELSEEALIELTRFFLHTCIDQVKFMEELMQPRRLRVRVQMWAEEETRLGKLPQKALIVLNEILLHGELSRSSVPGLFGTSDRQARRVVNVLVDRGVITSESMRAPLRLAFPAEIAQRWMPGIFPEKTTTD